MRKGETLVGDALSLFLCNEIRIAHTEKECKKKRRIKRRFVIEGKDYQRKENDAGLSSVVRIIRRSTVRDVKDRPILRAALSSNADFFLTGDKDFLESSVEDPRIISVAEFLSL